MGTLPGFGRVHLKCGRASMFWRGVRQAYGRAKVDLLRQRVLQAA